MRKLLVAAFIILLPSTAFADVTLFLGRNQTPTNRNVRGFAGGIGLLAVAFEFEYSSTSEDIEEAAPALKTYMFNGLLQLPFSIGGLQPYVTAGGGGFRETLEDESETSLGSNIGAGVKINLTGPLRVRLDYRQFKLRGSARYPNPKRLYAGVNLKF